MQDRFKFRVWHKKRQKMYDVLHLHTATWENGGEWVTAKGFNIITQQDIHIQIESKDGILMQCTGLKDKNGKLIYEGDIVEIMHYKGEKAVVYWDDEKCCFKLKGKKIAYNALITIRNDYFEVIGNIYDNQELLKED